MKKNLTSIIETMSVGDRVEFGAEETKYTSIRAIISCTCKNKPLEERIYAQHWSEDKKRIVVIRTR